MEYGPITAPPRRRPRRPSWASAILIATLTLLIGGAAGYLIGRASTGPAPTGSSTATPPAAGQTASPSTALDARAVLSRLKAAGLPMTNTAVQDENTDPNDLLGRPGGYTSRASFDVPGGNAEAERYLIDRGGVIEVFPSAAAARERSGYIQAIMKGTRVLGTEYHYLAGPVLLRITGSVKPSMAARFEAAVARL